MVITIPDSVYARLEAAAKRSGQTVEAELIALVEERLPPNGDHEEQGATVAGFVEALDELTADLHYEVDLVDVAHHTREIMRIGFLDKLHEAMKSFAMGDDVLADARNSREILRDEFATHLEQEMNQQN